MYLLATNVVSELRKPRPHGAVMSWLKSVGERSLYVSAVTIGEITSGRLKPTRDRDVSKAREMVAWLDLLGRFNAKRAGPFQKKGWDQADSVWYSGERNSIPLKASIGRSAVPRTRRDKVR